jgi:hypothetical protein
MPAKRQYIVVEWYNCRRNNEFTLIDSFFDIEEAMILVEKRCLETFPNEEMLKNVDDVYGGPRNSVYTVSIDDGWEKQCWSVVEIKLN